ncbi:PD-(D/E)XK nuclease family protein [Pelagovum pacificum]|uniref:Double-strand break repair protein AddB n=1 Tax=Pelagovum pacificum TaxID=2588711 RepID=A0A5C5GH55_9RHOB|nr:PD-(D/E)XK nuclease family protein [Pelagovum pacificum]QQA42760.1 PD-(D/E)XK nuclease family protein [Pelagovum pacificum]TNY34092.1 double-strand break repair protein AddB [Pelagovum pacificum]
MIFPESTGPRVFALPPGVDFGTELVRGLRERSSHLPPEHVARIELYLNTRRMQRRIRDVYDAGPPMLLPRLRLVTDLALAPVPGLTPPVGKMQRRLEIVRLVAALLDADPTLAPRSALFDLADSLSGLLDEMQGEGVDPDTLRQLDVSDQSEHWQRTLTFLNIVEPYFAGAVGAEARQRAAVERLSAQWTEAPPGQPMLIAGSTGSRGATAMFMEAVARLPQGAIVLPGFDFDLPRSVWESMTDGMSAEDHPQYRFRALFDRLGLSRRDVEPWTDAEPASASRNRLISLSLRPAPVTDAWQIEGPELRDIEGATSRVTLIEAPSPRSEAETIALVMRDAVEQGRSVSLISPDRMLTRQVEAALDRWLIVPDDSAGQPLSQTPTGRFLRHVGGLLTHRLTSEALLTLLKHPLCHGGSERGPHLLHTRELELHLRRHGPPFPNGDTLRAWAEKKPGREGWAAWLAARLDTIPAQDERDAPDHLALHLALAEAFAAGHGDGASQLWQRDAGRKAQEVLTEFGAHAAAAGTLSPLDYLSLFEGIIGGAEVRNPVTGHPLVRFWGTLESRVQGAEVVILGGLNEGSWPEVPSPDPWMNRSMRHKAGLLLPERRIGLSAHDYQQAVAGAEVVLSRASRSEDAATVPSRWINRLTNLMNGLPSNGGPEALAAMRARGALWVAKAARLSAPDRAVPPAPRPSPRPPVEARPKRLSVTQIQTLIRDPYAIYARNVLRLSALDPLVPEPDAPLRGIIIHSALERFIKAGHDPADPATRDQLVATARDALTDSCPWPAQRQLWLAGFERVADWFLETEVARRAVGTPSHFELRGKVHLGDPDFTLSCLADRLDLTEGGELILYDYKTGKPPTEKQQISFDRQLLLEAAMAARGAFAEVGPRRTVIAEFIGLGSSPAIVPAPMDEAPPDQVWEEFRALIRAWADPNRGYSARARAFTEESVGDYDHLARRGEWDGATDFTPEDIQ